MTKKLFMFVCITLLARAAFPHGNEQHVIGTVTKISQDSVTVQTVDKTLVEVKMVSDTIFTKNNIPGELRDLHVADREVIQAKRACEQPQPETWHSGHARSPT